MALTLSLALFFLVALDLIRGSRQPRVFLQIRFVLGCLIGGAYLGILALSRDGLSSLLPGLVAALPTLYILWAASQDRLLRRLIFAAVMIAVFFLASSIALSSPGALLNGDPHPFAVIGGGCLTAAAVALILPPARSPRLGWARGTGFAVLVAPLPILLAGWATIALWMEREARSVFPTERICFAQPNSRQTAHAYALVPGDVLFGRDYRGATRAWVLIGPEGGRWTHHWSFGTGQFSPNTSRAFLFDAPRFPKC
ncbi:hypothetical protein [Maritimibacter sp. DP1N21-5]|uniref:hypothetical protein n=1 Tax=Maritimibacter sp. DP1N21-5 TaxID=2836867 RepID=UPI001C48E9B6|nr:hypothetical protein [Maritimibacter sp. DP1N21-5]MBV7410024.1 hypothetical protein [Maritimibacter sp. DP1N21-5]